MSEALCNCIIRAKLDRALLSSSPLLHLPPLPILNPQGVGQVVRNRDTFVDVQCVAFFLCGVALGERSALLGINRLSIHVIDH